MNDREVFPLLIRLICTFIAAFPAVALWSRTRSASWIFVVLGALLAFVDALYAVLVAVGFVTYSLPILTNFPLLESVLAGGPFLFLALGFFFYLGQNRRY
ncbi:MAG: hypothetical protein MI717_06780 [Spirochaetales bacterium]|nr:hypothetical protein [Spirochaetales bacterium]